MGDLLTISTYIIPASVSGWNHMVRGILSALGKFIASTGLAR